MDFTIKKFIANLLIALFLLQPVTPAVFATHIPTETLDVSIERTDTLVWMYRTWEGQWQKRLWNDSKECWASEWMPA